MFPPLSIFKGVFKLPPASIITFDLEKFSGRLFDSFEDLITDNSVNFSNYWSIKDIYKENIEARYKSFDLAISDLKYELTEAVRSQLISDVPLGAFLSGGIDSSLIVGIMSSISSNVETFNIGFEFSEFDESPYAKEVAKHIGTRHTSVMCTKEDTMNYIMQCSSAYTEPFADSSQIPTMLVSKIASNSVKVVLTGDAGDELFGGYNRYTILQSTGVT